MADFVFNIAKGKVAEKAADGAILELLLLKAAEADATLEDYDTLGALLAAVGNTEADFTNYVRKTLAGTAVNVDDTNNRVDVDSNDVTWTSAGGTTDNTLVKAIIYEDVDGTDGNAVPLTCYDFSVTTDGSDLTLQFNTAGWFRAT